MKQFSNSRKRSKQENLCLVTSSAERCFHVVGLIGIISTHTLFDTVTAGPPDKSFEINFTYKNFILYKQVILQAKWKQKKYKDTENCKSTINE